MDGNEAEVQAVMGAMGSDGERQMKLRSLTHRSPPAVRPRSQQDADRYWSVARSLGTPGLKYYMDMPKVFINNSVFRK